MAGQHDVDDDQDVDAVAPPFDAAARVARDALADVAHLFDSIVVVTEEGSTRVTLLGGDLDAVLAVLDRACIAGPPTTGHIDSSRGGAVTLRWANGLLGTVAVELRWSVASPRKLAEKLEAREFAGKQDR